MPTTNSAAAGKRWAHEDDYNQAVAVACAKHGVAPALLKAIVAHETGFAPHAINNTGGDKLRGGSYGLAQMSLKTARIIAPDTTAAQLLQPSYNLDLAARFLADCLRAAAAHGYGVDSAVSAYNGGNSGVRPGDGKRVGVEAASPAEAKRHPFINQASYVDPVMANARYFITRGTPGASPAFDGAASGGVATGAAALGAVAAVAVLAFVFMRGA